jgi:hypothetical protein
LCNHGICLEVADILGLSIRRQLSYIYFGKGGDVICDLVSLLIEKLEIEVNPTQELIDPRGEWTKKRDRLCQELLTHLDDERFIALNPPNGWGSYEGFVPWIWRYIDACCEYPDADVSVSR